MVKLCPAGFNGEPGLAGMNGTNGEFYNIFQHAFYPTILLYLETIGEHIWNPKFELLSLLSVLLYVHKLKFI